MLNAVPTPPAQYAPEPSRHPDSSDIRHLSDAEWALKWPGIPRQSRPAAPAPTPPAPQPATAGYRKLLPAEAIDSCVARSLSTEEMAHFASTRELPERLFAAPAPTLVSRQCPSCKGSGRMPVGGGGGGLTGGVDRPAGEHVQTTYCWQCVGKGSVTDVVAAPPPPPVEGQDPNVDAADKTTLAVPDKLPELPWTILVKWLGYDNEHLAPTYWRSKDHLHACPQPKDPAPMDDVQMYQRLIYQERELARVRADLEAATLDRDRAAVSLDRCRADRDQIAADRDRLTAVIADLASPPGVHVDTLGAMPLSQPTQAGQQAPQPG